MKNNFGYFVAALCLVGAGCQTVVPVPSGTDTSVFRVVNGIAYGHGYSFSVPSEWESSVKNDSVQFLVGGKQVATFGCGFEGGFEAWEPVDHRERHITKNGKTYQVRLDIATPDPSVKTLGDKNWIFLGEGGTLGLAFYDCTVLSKDGLTATETDEAFRYVYGSFNRE